MIWFDVTKAAKAGHRSGLTRVSARLREEFKDAVQPVAWTACQQNAGPDDWFFTAELFSEAERPGIADFLARPPCRVAAVYHDAIPLKHPHITWPQSVRRHPGYMKLLAQVDRVFAISEASRDELLGFWRWQGVEPRGSVEVLPLGSDFNGAARVQRRSFPAAPVLLSVGIIEPRKNQALLLEVCSALWSEGLKFELHLIGRVNPYFGPPIVARIKELQKRHPGLHFHQAAPDGVVADLYRRARLSVFPTIAEGCGLPLLESLWNGVPCVCSDLPVLLENATSGCVTVPVNDGSAWQQTLRDLLRDDERVKTLMAEALARPLPTWAESARMILQSLGGAAD